jgi:hypothetical protein
VPFGVQESIGSGTIFLRTNLYVDSKFLIFMKFQLREPNTFMANECEAIVFTYSPSGIERAKKFCGADFVLAQKSRGVEVVGELHFRSCDAIMVAQERDFIVRPGQQHLRAIDGAIFRMWYKPLVPTKREAT